MKKKNLETKSHQKDMAAVFEQARKSYLLVVIRLEKEDDDETKLKRGWPTRGL